MLTMNRATLLGHAGRNPEMRRLPSGEEAAMFSLATTERFRRRDGTEGESTEWHAVVAYGAAAQAVRNLVRRGAPVLVEGRISTRTWTDRTGAERRTTEIVVSGPQSQVNVLAKRAKGDDGPPGGAAAGVAKAGAPEGTGAGEDGTAAPAAAAADAGGEDAGAAGAAASPEGGDGTGESGGAAVSGDAAPAGDAGAANGAADGGAGQSGNGKESPAGGEGGRDTARAGPSNGTAAAGKRGGGEDGTVRKGGRGRRRTPAGGGAGDE